MAMSENVRCRRHTDDDISLVVPGKASGVRSARFNSDKKPCKNQTNSDTDRARLHEGSNRFGSKTDLPCQKAEICRHQPKIGSRLASPHEAGRTTAVSQVISCPGWRFLKALNPHRESPHMQGTRIRSGRDATAFSRLRSGSKPGHLASVTSQHIARRR